MFFSAKKIFISSKRFYKKGRGKQHDSDEKTCETIFVFLQIAFWSNFAFFVICHRYVYYLITTCFSLHIELLISQLINSCYLSRQIQSFQEFLQISPWFYWLHNEFNERYDIIIMDDFMWIDSKIFQSNITPINEMMK